MKKVSLLFVLLSVWFCSFSQPKGKDYITMKSDGKVYWIRGGETIRMMIDVPLKDGSVVNYKGNVTSKDGDIKQLSKGDVIMMDGKFLPKKKTKK